MPCIHGTSTLLTIATMDGMGRLDGETAFFIFLGLFAQHVRRVFIHAFLSTFHLARTPLLDARAFLVFSCFILSSIGLFLTMCYEERIMIRYAGNGHHHVARAEMFPSQRGGVLMKSMGMCERLS